MSSSAVGSIWATEIGDVTGAGRQVEQQHVQVAPEHVGEKLLQQARCSIGPRQTTGVLPLVNMPMEMTFTSCADGGMIMFSTGVGLPVTPSIRGTECP